MDENKQNEIPEEDEFFIDYEEVDIKRINELEEPKIVPTYTKSELKEAANKLDEETFKAMDDETKASLKLAIESSDFINPDDIGKRKQSDGLTNKPVYGDKELLLKELNIGKRVKSSKAALLKLTQVTGIGSMIHIPLWHSGFWITLTPLVDEEIINFELELINELDRVGRITNTLVFSNYSVIFTEVLMNNFKNKIQNTSLKLEEGEELFDYISINDLYIIALSIAKSMYPHGFQAVIPCKNTIKFDDSNMPLCSYKAALKLDLSKLLFVDFDKLSIDHKNQMSKKTPNSVSVADVKKYQETLPVGGREDIVFKTDNGEIKLTLGVSNITRYLESGRLFIEHLRDKTNELIKNNKQLEDPAQIEHMLVNSIYLQLFNHYIQQIPFDDTVLTELDDINEALSIFSSDHKLSKKVMTSIKKYIDNSLIATVGVPNFICPNCKAEQIDKEIIPLSVYEYFFILLHSRHEKILQKLLET